MVRDEPTKASAPELLQYESPPGPKYVSPAGRFTNLCLGVFSMALMLSAASMTFVLSRGIYANLFRPRSEVGETVGILGVLLVGASVTVVFGLATWTYLRVTITGVECGAPTTKDDGPPELEDE